MVHSRATNRQQVATLIHCYQQFGLAPEVDEPRYLSIGENAGTFGALRCCFYMKISSMFPVRVVLAFSLLVLVALGCARTSVDAITLARQAAGWHRLPASSALRLSGESHLLGVTGTFESLFAEGGRFRRAVSGSLARKVHFDGETLRRRPISSALQPVELYARESEPLRAWVRSGYWLSTGWT